MGTGKNQHIHLPPHLVKSSSPMSVTIRHPVTGGYITSMATTLTSWREVKCMMIQIDKTSLDLLTLR